MAAGTGVRVYNHLLGECGVTVFVSPALAATYGRGFPGSMDGAPFLMPSAQSALRRTLDAWLERAGVRPAVVAEFDDSSLLTTFGEAGVGLFAAPSAIRAEVRRQYRVRRLGSLPGARERFYAITVHRQIKHPAVAAISTAARSRLRA